MNNTLYLFVGKSGSGKSTIADVLENKYGYNVVESYTTRCPRYHGERGHIFLSNTEYNELQDIVASTEYNGNKYCTTKQMLDKCKVYPIDIPGIKVLLKRYTNRPIVIIYFDSTVRTRIERMQNRHDSDSAIVSRLYNDEKSDWFSELKILAEGKAQLYKIDANQTMQDVLYQTMKCMNMNGGDSHADRL